MISTHLSKLIPCILLLGLTMVFAETKIPILSNLIERTEWGGPPTGNERGKASQTEAQGADDIKYLSIHNFVCPKNLELTRMKSNHDMHVNAGYGYLAYHFVVGDSGTVYQGRSPSLAPASYTYYLNEEQLLTEVASVKNGGVTFKQDFKDWTSDKIPGNTKGHITVSLMCGGRVENGAVVAHSELLDPKAMDVVVELVAELLVRYENLTPDSIRAHREIAETSCPNDKIYRWLRGTAMSKNTEGPGLAKIRKRYEELLASEALETKR